MLVLVPALMLRLAVRTAEVVYWSAGSNVRRGQRLTMIRGVVSSDRNNKMRFAGFWASNARREAMRVVGEESEKARKMVRILDVLGTST